MRLCLPLISLFICTTTSFAVAARPSANEIIRLKTERSASLYQDPETGRVRHVSGKLAENVTQGKEIDAFSHFLDDYRVVYGMKEPSEELKLRRFDTDALGMRHVRMMQQYKGVPVYGGELIAHFSTDGIMKAINGTFFEDIDLDVTPVVTASEAQRQALSDLTSFFGPGDPDEPELTIFTDESKESLSWHFMLRSQKPLGRWDYFVDARTGEILQKINMIQEVDAIGIGVGVLGQPRNHIDADFDGTEYRLIDATRQVQNNPHGHNGQMPPGGVIQTSTYGDPLPGPVMTDPDNVWNDPAQAPAVDAHVWTALVYDWMLATLGRNSYDDAGASMVTTVDFEYDYDNNAAWIGDQIVIFTASEDCNSLAACPDVIGHEWAHAVTQFSSGLLYQRESGALNESFSDMMGTAFEVAHDTLDEPDWLMGENFGCMFGVRDVSDPAAFSQPDYYGGDHWSDPSVCFVHESNDYCYVHRNGGVGNKWFYLLSMGGTHHDVTVTGIGVENAMKIAYRANVYYWSQFANYAEGALGTELAADDLDPTGQWREQVTRAWDAVGVFTRPSPQVAFSYPQGRPALLQPGATTSSVVKIDTSFQALIVPGSVCLDVRIDGGTIQKILLEETSPGLYAFELPALDCGRYLEYMIEAQEAILGLCVDINDGIWWRAAPGTHATVLLQHDFESEYSSIGHCFFVERNKWKRGMPTGATCEVGGPEPRWAHSGSYVFGHILDGSEDSADPFGPWWYTYNWPYLNCSQYDVVKLSFWRWLNVERPSDENVYVAVSTIGSYDTTALIKVWANDTSINDTHWQRMEVDISHIAARQPKVWVSFVKGPSGVVLWESCGWNIDDVTVTGYTCDATADTDIDQIPDYLDNCALVSNADQLDADGDGVGNPCDLCLGFNDSMDGDFDGSPDACDNCVSNTNPDQADANADGIGDNCCCEGLLGDANLDFAPEPTLSDIMVIVDHLFISSVPLGCYQEADLNQSGGVDPTSADISLIDVMYLVDYLFISGPAAVLPDCPPRD